MKNQKGYIQLLIVIFFVGMFFVVVSAYLFRDSDYDIEKINLSSPTSTIHLRYPKGIIDDLGKDIEDIKKERNKELDELLENYLDNN